jgi:hypothetical protein
LRQSRLAEGRLARFYELKTNKPLYFTKQYELTYDDFDLPTHYGFKVGDGTAAIEREYERLSKLSPAELAPRPREATAKRGKPSASLVSQTKEAIAALDNRGAWVEEGKLKSHGDDDPTRRVIDCRTFIKNIGTLSSYLAAPRPEPRRD